MKQATTLIYALLFATISYAGIYCPPNIVIDCTDDIHNTHVTGVATTAGQYYGITPKYVDWGTIGQCSSGTIHRKWYIDLNWNNELDPYEPFCVQYITVTFDSEPVLITWPEDISLSCDDDVPPSYPWISHGPCNMVGWSSEDIEFSIGNGVCDKIIRRFTVIDWCTYDHGSEGIWIHEQKIFFADEHAPEIKSCEDITLSTIDCKGEFTISNSAVDTGFCHNENIAWQVLIDLHSDGKIDYEYGTHIYGDFNIPYTKNCDTVTITLPEHVGIGWHQVTWKITDNCGNPDYCSQMVTMKDTKPPTPICYNNLSTVLMAGSGMVELNANTIIKEAYDNCSWPEWIDYSFSPDPADVTKVFTCDDFGVQNVQVYAIDHYGNYDYCKVTILFDDHDNVCPDMLDYAAEVMRYDGEGIEDVSFKFLNYNGDMVNEAMSNDEGYFEFKDTELSQHLRLNPYKEELTGDVSILDLVTMKNVLLGHIELDEVHSYLADINKDQSIGIEDFIMLREKILFQSEDVLEFANYNDRIDTYEFNQTWGLRDVADISTYYAFVLGDIAKSNHKGNNHYTENRSIPFEWVKSGDRNQLISTANICLDAMILDLSNFEGVKDLHSIFEDTELLEKDGISNLACLSNDCVQVSKDQVILEWESTSHTHQPLTVKTANLYEQLENSYMLQFREDQNGLDIKVLENSIQIHAQETVQYDYQVLDVQGRVLSTMNKQIGSADIPKSDLTAGLYFIQVRSKEMNSKLLIEKFFVE